MSTTGAVNPGHSGETSVDPNNLSGQLFMKGKRDNPTLQLIGGMQAIRGVSNKESDCSQNFEVPDPTVLPERIKGGLAPAFVGVDRQPKNVVEILH